MDFNTAEKFIIIIEQFYSTEVSFSESFIRSDLETRAAQDRIKQMQGIWTNELEKKKSFYYQCFDESLSKINSVLECARIHCWDTNFIARCERCKEQVKKLRNLVQNF